MRAMRAMRAMRGKRGWGAARGEPCQRTCSQQLGGGRRNACERVCYCGSYGSVGVAGHCGAMGAEPWQRSAGGRGRGAVVTRVNGCATVGQRGGATNRWRPADGKGVNGGAAKWQTETVGLGTGERRRRKGVMQAGGVLGWHGLACAIWVSGKGPLNTVRTADWRPVWPRGRVDGVFRG